MIVILLATAFLCGVPLGFILGMIMFWRLSKSLPSEDVDYSGGV